MRKYINMIAAFTALCSLLFVSFPVAADEYSLRKAELAQVEKAQEEARELLAELAKDESAVMAELRQLEQELASAEQELAVVEQDLQRTEQGIREVKRDIKRAEEVARESEAALKSVLKDYNQRLRQIYMSGGADIFDLLLETGSAGDLALRMRLFTALLAEDVALYEEVKAKKERAEADRKDLEVKYSALSQKEGRLEELRRTAVSRVEEVKKAKAKRDARLKEILSQKRTQEQVLNELQETSHKLEAWLKEHETPALPKDQTGKVRLTWPVRGQVTAEYGWRVHPIDKVKRFHEGIDIEAAQGTPIKAAAAGRVALSGWVGGYGYTVILEHADGFSTVYAHASKLLVQAGDLVQAGQTIAEVGSTGLSTGPHLHFEVRRSGQAVDPREYLKE
ncbi:MAG: peptidoglycan DD-metalloendopeptidase family protein [Firmicutes bacterium]|nr:peptidoglycan DD-metalloendopeptidase family protein [Bacillota bacterium]